MSKLKSIMSGSVAAIMALTVAWTTPALAKVSCDRDGWTMVGKAIDDDNDAEVSGETWIKRSTECAGDPELGLPDPKRFGNVIPACGDVLKWFAQYGINLGTLC